jgi:DHA1 family bicyclomycin/chloramphenicol resistance-like MFS transporter
MTAIPEAAPATSPFPTRLLLLLGALTALAPLSIDMYLPALPKIAEALGASDEAARLTLSSFMVGLGIGQLVYGPLSDRLGRRTPLLVGLVAFILGSVGCGLAPDLPTLIVFRFIQAFGGSAGVVLGRAIVRDHASGAEAAKLLSSLILIMGVAPIVAPTLGTFVLAWGGWRSLFGAVALAGVVGLGAAGSWLPGSTPKSGGPGAWADFGAVLSDRTFLTRAMANAAGGAGMFAYISSAPFVFIDGYGFSERGFALFFGANAAGFIAASQVNRALLGRFRTDQLLLGGAGVTLGASMGLLALAAGEIGGVWVWSGLLWLWLGSLGFVLPNSTALALERHGSRAGSASALIGCGQYAMAGLSTALTGQLPGTAQEGMAGAVALASLVVFGAVVAGRSTERA